MSAAGWIVVVAWAVLGLPAGVAVTRWSFADSYRYGRQPHPILAGWSVICGWALAPVLIFTTLVCCGCWLIGRAIAPAREAQP